MREDVTALAGMVRSSAAAGERLAAEWIAARLSERGAGDGELWSFRGRGTYAWAHAAHVAFALRGGPAALVALASLELEAGGRFPWVRRLLPAGTGTNLVVSPPAVMGEAPEAAVTVVLVAHTDTARTGLVWHPRVANPGAGRRLRTRSIDPYLAPVALGMVLASLPSRRARRAGRVLLSVALAAEVEVAAGAHVPGASDNATGVAVAMALLADPPPGVRLLGVFCGCEESGMDGMAAWLRSPQARALDPARTLVLNLDTLGAGTPMVLRAEGALLAAHYRERDLALADAGAARAGMAVPQRWRIGGWTDAVLALRAGFPALSLLSVGPEGKFTNYHLPSDTVENVDWSSVAACAALARGICEAAGAELRD